MTESEVGEICDVVESKLDNEHGKRWNSIISESIAEKASDAGRTYENRTVDDVGNGCAEALPQITKEYTKLFVRQALIEIFCDNDR